MRDACQAGGVQQQLPGQLLQRRAALLLLLRAWVLVVAVVEAALLQQRQAGAHSIHAQQLCLVVCCCQHLPNRLPARLAAAVQALLQQQPGPAPALAVLQQGVTAGWPAAAGDGHSSAQRQQQGQKLPPSSCQGQAQLRGPACCLHLLLQLQDGGQHLQRQLQHRQLRQLLHGSRGSGQQRVRHCWRLLQQSLLLEPAQQLDRHRRRHRSICVAAATQKLLRCRAHRTCQAACRLLDLPPGACQPLLRVPQDDVPLSGRHVRPAVAHTAELQLAVQLGCCRGICAACCCWCGCCCGGCGAHVPQQGSQPLALCCSTHCRALLRLRTVALLLVLLVVLRVSQVDGEACHCQLQQRQRHCSLSTSTLLQGGCLYQLE